MLTAMILMYICTTLAMQLTTVMKHCVTMYNGRWLCPGALSL